MSQRKRKRLSSHGKKQSKEERLLKRNQKNSVIISKDLEKFDELLHSNKSEFWDEAQRIASNDDTLQMKMIVHILKEKKIKMAFHYAKRLEVSEELAISCCQTIDKSTAAHFLNLYLQKPQNALKTILQQAFYDGDYDSLKTILHGQNELQILFLQHALTTGYGIHLVNHYVKSIPNALQSTQILNKINENEIPRNQRFDQLTLVMNQHFQMNEHDESLEQTKRESIRNEIEKCLQIKYPTAQVYLFGSSASGLGLPEDDLDLCLLLPEMADPVNSSIIIDLGEHLKQSMNQVIPIPGARVPVIRFVHPTTQLKCDLCVNNRPALWNTEIIHQCVLFFKPFKILCRSIKLWAKQRHLCHSKALNSYSIVLMVIVFLQQHKHLPFVDVFQHDHDHDPDFLQKIPIDRIQENLERRFFSSSTAKKDHPPSLGQLFHQFFLYWGTEFSYSKHIATLRRDNLCKSGHPWKRAKTVLSLEDPIEIHRDLGLSLTQMNQRILRCEMIRVCLLLNFPTYEDIFSSSTLKILKLEDEQVYDIVVRPREWKHATSGHYHMGGDYEKAILQTPQVVLLSSREQAEKAIAHAFVVKTIGIDCEGDRLRRQGRICLISMSVELQVYLFDLVSVGNQFIDLLKPLLESNLVMKVIHDCRYESDSLFHQFGIRLNLVFDTQVAHRLLEQQRHHLSTHFSQVEVGTQTSHSPPPQEAGPASTEPASTGPASTGPASTGPASIEPESTDPASTEPESTEPASTEPASTEPAPGSAPTGSPAVVFSASMVTKSLSYLLETYLSIHHSLKEVYHEKMKKDDEFWRKNYPYSQEMQQYAALDVFYLVPLYNLMEKEFISLFKSRLNKEIQYYLDVRDILYDTLELNKEKRIHGVINNIMPKGIYVTIGDGITGFAPFHKKQDEQVIENQIYSIAQPVVVRLTNMDMYMKKYILEIVPIKENNKFLE